MWDLCRYKNMFGKPNTGIHTYRLFNISIIDVLLTIILAWLIKHLILPSTEIVEILFICLDMSTFFINLYHFENTNKI